MTPSGFTIVFGGPDFRPGDFLRDSRLDAAVIHRGEALSGGDTAEESWLEFFDIREGAYPLDIATEALDFLESHHDEFLRLSRFPGVSTRTLNFFGPPASCSTEFTPRHIALLHELSLQVAIDVWEAPFAK